MLKVYWMEVSRILHSSLQRCHCGSLLVSFCSIFFFICFSERFLLEWMLETGSVSFVVRVWMSLPVRACRFVRNLVLKVVVLFLLITTVLFRRFSQGKLNYAACTVALLFLFFGDLFFVLLWLTCSVFLQLWFILTCALVVLDTFSLWDWLTVFSCLKSVRTGWCLYDLYDLWLTQVGEAVFSCSSVCFSSFSKYQLGNWVHDFCLIHRLW